jgi:hypothetical protein
MGINVSISVESRVLVVLDMITSGLAGLGGVVDVVVAGVVVAVVVFAAVDEGDVVVVSLVQLIADAIKTISSVKINKNLASFSFIVFPPDKIIGSNPTLCYKTHNDQIITWKRYGCKYITKCEICFDGWRSF